MSLLYHPLPHYSDFDGTSESEASEVSIVKSYCYRFRPNKNFTSPDVQPIKRRGNRAMRRYENDAYLSSLMMITETDAEYEEDTYWPDKSCEDTGFKCLFEDEDMRAIWDAFISLSERKQIELLESLGHHRATSFDISMDDDYDMCDQPIKPKKRVTYHNQKSSKKSTFNEHRHRIFDVIDESKASLSLQSTSTIGIVPVVGDISDNISKFVNISSLLDNKKDINHEESNSVGVISPKLRDLKITPLYPKPSGKRSGKKKHSLNLQDLCLIQQVESELRNCFSWKSMNFSSYKWTPTTSLLRLSSEVDEFSCLPSDPKNPSDQPLLLNGFQRLIVHAIASYLGLSSHSTWNEVMQCRQLWVVNKNTYFKPLKIRFICLLQESSMRKRVS